MTIFVTIFVYSYTSAALRAQTIEKLEFEKKQLQRETELLKGRVETLDKQLAHAQKHLEERDARLSKFDVEKRCALVKWLDMSSRGD